MEKGDILGHENMGEVVAVGSGVSNLKVGDRVVVPLTLCCGECFFCKKGLFSWVTLEESSKVPKEHRPAGWRRDRFEQLLVAENVRLLLPRVPVIGDVQFS
jgi:threonine dehydrogenase-like Zn-dependent dehydrogenase